MRMGVLPNLVSKILPKQPVTKEGLLEETLIAKAGGEWELKNKPYYKDGRSHDNRAADWLFHEVSSNHLKVVEQRTKLSSSLKEPSC